MPKFIMIGKHALNPEAICAVSEVDYQGKKTCEVRLTDGKHYRTPHTVEEVLKIIERDAE